MQFTSHATNQDITSYVDDVLGTNSTSFPITSKVRFANEGLNIVSSWIDSVYGGWIRGDTNLTELPELTTQLESGQSFYALEASSGRLFGVSYKDTNGDWFTLKPITLEEIMRTGDEAEFEPTNGKPIYYRPLANGFKIYPASNFTQADSLKIFVDEDVSRFATTDTTKEPGFPPQFHEAIPTYIILQYAEKNNLETLAKKYRRKWSNDSDRDYPEGFEQRIKKFYKERFKQNFPQRIIIRDVINQYE